MQPAPRAKKHETGINRGKRATGAGAGVGKHETVTKRGKTRTTQIMSCFVLASDKLKTKRVTRHS